MKAKRIFPIKHSLSFLCLITLARASLSANNRPFTIEVPKDAKLRQTTAPKFSQSILFESTSIHVLALAPFQISSVSGASAVTQKAQIEAQKADTLDVWLGYPQVAYPADSPCVAENNAKSCKECTGSEVATAADPFICCDVGGTCITSYQAAVYNLLQNPIGGQYIPGTGWCWNGPATGGVVISLFGMGFGWNSLQCTQQCLQNPDTSYCGQDSDWPCTYVLASVGNTQASLAASDPSPRDGRRRVSRPPRRGAAATWTTAP